MHFFAPPTRLVLYSNLAPDQCARRLAAAIDPERLSIFSLSGYSGSKRFLGMVEGRHFRIFQRTYGRNAFPPVLSGELQPRGEGTRVEGAFDLELTSKIAICFILAFMVLPTTLVVYYSLASHTVAQWLAIPFACASATFTFFGPRIIREIGRGQERDITDFVWATLEAGDDASAFKSGSG
jgi:hypothetical protein